MKLSMFQVDAFASQVFSGNPAAVVLLEEELEAETMQAIAAENNLSETAFVLPGERVFHLRWFTPIVEVDLCGHATLASAHVLFEMGWVSGAVDFETASGRLSVVQSEDLLCMNFPVLRPRLITAPEGLAAALRTEPTEVLSARDLVAVFETEKEVVDLQPDFAKMEKLNAFAVVTTAPGSNVDFVSRFFAPKVGVLEDPVTGSAHCTLTPLWAERLGKRVLRARQVSPRGGELFCEQRGDRVIISGRAVTYLRGEIDF